VSTVHWLKMLIGVGVEVECVIRMDEKQFLCDNLSCVCVREKFIMSSSTRALSLLFKMPSVDIWKLGLDSG
jgi:hypothetical protein